MHKCAFICQEETKPLLTTDNRLALSLRRCLKTGRCEHDAHAKA